MLTGTNESPHYTFTASGSPIDTLVKGATYTFVVSNDGYFDTHPLNIGTGGSSSEQLTKFSIVEGSGAMPHPMVVLLRLLFQKM